MPTCGRACFSGCVSVCIHMHVALGLALYGSSHPGFSQDLIWFFWLILGPRACVLSVGGAVLGPVPADKTLAPPETGLQRCPLML